MTAAEDGQVLADWWRDQAQEEINRTVPKAVEYGAGDLAEIGRTMGRLMGRDKLTEQDATEIGVFFYLVGKVARWEQAIRDGRQVSEDTLFDIGVYARMASRTRQVGGWPWATETETDAATALADRYFEGDGLRQWAARGVVIPQEQIEYNPADTVSQLKTGMAGALGDDQCASTTVRGISYGSGPLGGAGQVQVRCIGVDGHDGPHYDESLPRFSWVDAPTPREGM